MGDLTLPQDMETLVQKIESINPLQSDIKDYEDVGLRQKVAQYTKTRQGTVAFIVTSAIAFILLFDTHTAKIFSRIKTLEQEAEKIGQNARQMLEPYACLCRTIAET